MQCLHTLSRRLHSKHPPLSHQVSILVDDEDEVVVPGEDPTDPDAYIITEYEWNKDGANGKPAPKAMDLKQKVAKNNTEPVCRYYYYLAISLMFHSPAVRSTQSQYIVNNLLPSM